MPTVLVVDDDRSVRHMLTRGLAEGELHVQSAESAEEALAQIRNDRFDVVLLDIVLPDTSGLEAFSQIQALDNKLPVIFMTARGTSDTAIEAMKLGAYDYLLKPLDLPHVRDVVGQAVNIRRLMSVPVEVSETISADDKGDQIVGRSPHMQDVFKAIGRVAPQNVTVLIRGESGTGKELVARAIYQHSHRSDGPFLAVNCAAIPENLLESELFGHEKGAFTGAERRRIGKFEQASGGTIFLDEIGDMPPLLQSKILRLLQEQKFERVGGNDTITTDVRIIAATNRDLEEMVEESEFREDLFYRINGYTISLPTLNERGSDDVVLLLQHFLARIGRQIDKPVKQISPEALELLKKYLWPGNVRELESVIRKAMLEATGTVIVPEFLPRTIREGKADAAAREQLEQGGQHDLAAYVEQRLAAKSQNLYAETLEMMEQYVLTRVLQLTEGNQSKASRILGITRGSLRHKIRSLGITIGAVVKADDDSPEDDDDDEFD